MRAQSDSIPPGGGGGGGVHNGEGGDARINNDGSTPPMASTNGGSSNGTNGHFDLESPTGSILSGASSIGAMSLPPGVGVMSSRAATLLSSGKCAASSDMDLISTMCQKISTDLGALGADWESSSEILDLSQSTC